LSAMNPLKIGCQT